MKTSDKVHNRYPMIGALAGKLGLEVIKALNFIFQELAIIANSGST